MKPIRAKKIETKIKVKKKGGKRKAIKNQTEKGGGNKQIETQKR
jgi:hypothetical protein